MPGKIGVKIKAGRNLPIMDKSSDTTDAYVEIKFCNVTHKTDVCRKSLNPSWNTDWYRFEVDDAELQDEPLQIRLMDYDTYSANDAIGKVNISLNPLCLENAGLASHGKGSVLTGWIPVFDTMHGIRGEINVIVKVDLFSDVNKFRQSSCGIPFYHSPCVPFGYRAQVIHGFVEELVVNDDPEYQWIDKIRTPRASNEARQVVFLKLSGQIQRKMGLKAINMGANAVIGYTQCFDLEGDVGVVARGVGTAVTLIKDTTGSQAMSTDAALIEDVTKKYLEFLTCAGGQWPRANRTPHYKLNVNKSQSIDMFFLESASSDTEDAEIMQNLIRQEDERGEKSKKKLRHRMRRLTHSSRSIFSEKYATLIRRIEPKIPENATHSLSSIFTSRDSLRSLCKGNDRRRRSISQQPRVLLNKPAHSIVRSVSDDSAVKQRNSSISASDSMIDSSMMALGEYQENTRSAPDITAAEQAPEPQCNVSHAAAETLRRSSSSETISQQGIGIFDVELALAEAKPNYADSESEIQDLDNDEDAVADADDAYQQQWIKPGDTRSCEKSLPNLAPKRSTLMRDLSAFSKRLQQLIHLPAKKPPTAQAAVLPAVALLLLPPEERKSYYSSQPEIPTACELEPRLLGEACGYPTLDYARRAVSLSNLAYAHTHVHDVQDLTVSDVQRRQSPTPPCTLQLSNPVLRICPSTPTPTETEQLHFSPSIMALTDSYLNQNIEFTSPISIPSSPPLGSQSFTSCPSSCPAHFDFSDHVVNSRTSSSTNQHSNNNNQTLLAPCFSVSPFAIQNRQQQQQLPPQPPPPQSTPTNRSSELPTPVVNYNVPKNESNAATGLAMTSIGSPSLKRIASPVGNSRLKLSPSPSKSAISGTTVLASDSASTSTTSTATTMVPKELGEICRRSSDSDLSVTPKGNSICVASERLVAATAMMRLTQPIVKNTTTDNLDMLEYPFLTMTKYPSGFILHLGATVAARSVKLLERVPNPDEPEVRDSWWTELRMEIRSHARSLGCNVVLGYEECTSISDDVCVLSATGTAAVINMVFNRSVSQTDIFTMAKAAAGAVPTNVGMSASLEEQDMTSNTGSSQDPNKETASLGNANSNSAGGGRKYGIPPLNLPRNTCAMCHVPYNLSAVPFNVKMRKCSICRKGRVPDVLLATLELPEFIQVTGRGCFMQAQVVRAKKDLRAELNAKEISDGLPFLEYELHRMLINKLKAKGMNAIFGLRTQVAIGERMIALIATGTALFLSALPMPQVPKIVAGNTWTDKQKLNELQKKLQETFERNQEIYQLKNIDPDTTPISAGGNVDKQSDTDDSDDEEMNDIDLNCGNKELCVLEVDDIEDLEIISLLMEPYPPEGFHVVNTQQVPGMVDMETVKNLQMFTQVWRARLDVGANVNGFPKHFQRLLQTIYFKLRTMIPCAICDLRFRLDLPETDQIQLLVTGMALGLNDANKPIKYRRKAVNQNGFAESVAPVPIAATQLPSATPTTLPELNGKRMLQDEDYIFPLDEDQMVDTPTPTSNLPPFGLSSFKVRKTSPSRVNTTTGGVATATARNSSTLQAPRTRYFPLRDRYGVDITPLSFIPGGRIEKYLGNLNFFFIRESTSIRENGGISGFVHGFITELLAVVRAHIAALGGNAMVSFYMTELILFDNQNKNHGQCLISIGGDAVYVSYYADE